MAINKKFVCGVGRTFNYDASDNLLWVGKTLISSAIDISNSQTELRAGPGNVLQMVYFYGGTMKVTQEDQQFNLAMISKTLGSAITTGVNIWSEETVTLTGGAGSILGTPLATSSGNIYGWAELSDGTYERFTFSTKSFTITGQLTGSVCVRYWNANAAARQVTVNANIIPAVVRTVIEAQMFSGDPNSLSTSTLCGRVLVEVPKLQLDGAAKLDLTSTGVSNTSITGTALASTVAGCSSSGTYATITEIVDSSNWYDKVAFLAVSDNTITLNTANSPLTLQVWAVPNDGSAAFIPPIADLSFISGTPSTFTAGLHTGILTKVASSGTANCDISITAKPAVTLEVVVTMG